MARWGDAGSAAIWRRADHQYSQCWQSTLARVARQAKPLRRAGDAEVLLTRLRRPTVVEEQSHSGRKALLPGVDRRTRIAGARNATGSDLDHALPAILPRQQSDQRRRRVFEPVDHVLFDFELAVPHPRAEIGGRRVAFA